MNRLHQRLTIFIIPAHHLAREYLRLGRSRFLFINLKNIKPQLSLRFKFRP